MKERKGLRAVAAPFLNKEGMAMMEYKYVPVKFGHSNSSARHRRIIDEHAADGWRYVGWVPLTKTVFGMDIKTADLVFEKPTKDGK